MSVPQLTESHPSIAQPEPVGVAAAPSLDPAFGSDRATRAVAIVALAVAAVVHVPVAIEHLTELPYLGYSFYGLVLLAAAALGSLLVESRTFVWRGALVLGTVAVAAYVASRSVGLPMADDDRGDWTNPLGVTAVCAELVVVAVALLVLGHRHRHRS